MSTTIMIILGLIVFIAIGVMIIQNVREKAYQKGYDHGESDVVARVLSTSYWFTEKDIKLYNAFQLFGLRYKKYRGILPNQYREDILKMNHDKHFTEIPRDELEKII